MYIVGDDLNNDVLAGQVVGMTGVLVRTGKFRQDTLDRWAADEFAMQPNHVIGSVADLPELLGLEVDCWPEPSSRDSFRTASIRASSCTQFAAATGGPPQPAELVVDPAVRLARSMVPPIPAR